LVIISLINISNTLISTNNGLIIGTVNSFDNIMPVIVRDINSIIRQSLPFFNKIIRNLLYRVVPVRTGKLLDKMLQTLRIEYIGNILHVSTLIPGGYPVIIRNPRHVNEIGYGPKYEPINPIPNRNVLRHTKKGAYYLLNDPSAEESYSRVLGKKF